jgi:hypothetical protein
MFMAEARSGIGVQPDILTRSRRQVARRWNFILHFVFLFIDSLDATKRVRIGGLGITGKVDVTNNRLVDRSYGFSLGKIKNWGHCTACRTAFIFSFLGRGKRNATRGTIGRSFAI